MKVIMLLCSPPKYSGLSSHGSMPGNGDGIGGLPKTTAGGDRFPARPFYRTPTASH